MISLQDTNRIWAKISDKLSVSISMVAYCVYFKNIIPYTVRDTTLILLAPLESHRNVINNNYRQSLLTAFKACDAPFDDFMIILDSEKDSFAPLQDKEAAAETVELSESMTFIKEYTFQSFVIGDSNKLAAMAALAVADKPGSIYNPLFIYSRPGLGKTHLLNAIGNFIKDCRKDLEIMYVTAENFTNDYIYSIRNNKNADFMKSFNEKYRGKDVLMIDDIQFLEKAEKTQEALFHIFNDLYAKNKQIIISSDRPIKNLTFLDERLASRFASGITVDIQPPSFEDRVAILLHKSHQYNFNISEKVLYYLADLEKSNIRVLEGMLKTIGIYSKLKEPVDSIDFVNEALRTATTTENNVTIDSITKATADYFNVKMEDILGSRRTKDVVLPRQFAIYLVSVMLPDRPLSNMVEYFKRDHSTIISARDKIGSKYESDEHVRTMLDDIKNIVLNK